MSKGNRRRFFVALANRKRNPESWFPGVPTMAEKAGKNRVWTKPPKPKGGRGRNV